MGIAKRTWLAASVLAVVIILAVLYSIGIPYEWIAPIPGLSREIMPSVGIGKPAFQEGPLTGQLTTFEFKDALDLKTWKEHVTAREKTLYELENLANGEKALRAYSRAGSSGLFQKVGIEMAQRPFLTWEWKVTQFPSHKKNEVLGGKADNDFAARVIAIFRGKNPILYEIIHYVWDDHFPEGTYRASPHNKRVRILVVQNGPKDPSQEWVREERDLFKDHEMLFGRAPRSHLEAIGIFTDSDNTHTEAEAFYKSISIYFPPK